MNFKELSIQNFFEFAVTSCGRFIGGSDFIDNSWNVELFSWIPLVHGFCAIRTFH